MFSYMCHPAQGQAKKEARSPTAYEGDGVQSVPVLAASVPPWCVWERYWGPQLANQHLSLTLSLSLLPSQCLSSSPRACDARFLYKPLERTFSAFLGERRRADWSTTPTAKWIHSVEISLKGQRAEPLKQHFIKASRKREGCRSLWINLCPRFLG